MVLIKECQLPEMDPSVTNQASPHPQGKGRLGARYREYGLFLFTLSAAYKINNSVV